MLTAETFWICRSTQSVWEHLPGSICVVTRIVPISLVVSKLCPPFIPVSFLTNLVLSDGRFGRNLGYRPVDGKATSPVSLVGLGYLSPVNSDRQGCSHRGIAFPLTFNLLHVNRDYTGLTGARCSGDGQARYLGSNFRCGNPRSLAHYIQTYYVYVSFLGAVGAAVSIIVCNMSVIIPALLRALGVGDPFMQEDTVDPGFSTDVEIVRMASTRVELGLPTSRGTALTDSDESQGTIGTVASRRDPIVLGVKDERKRQLSTKASDGSLGGLKRTKVVPLVDESDIADSLAQVRSLPTVKTDQEIESDARGRHVKNNST